MLRRPLAVIFDMDGLLFDTEALYRNALLEAARDRGYRFAVDDFLELVGRQWEQNRSTVQERIGTSEDVEGFRLAWLDKYALLKGSIELKAGAVELLDRLDDLKIPRAVCTSSSHEDVSHNLGLHGLIERFDAVVAAGDYVRSKPAPDPFLKAAEVLSVSPADCLALEDSYNGVRAAAAAGMRTIMIPDLLPPTDEFRSLCHSVVADLHDIHPLLA